MIELMVVLMVMVIMMSFAVPRLFVKSIGKQRQEFLAQFETLISSGVVQALQSGQPCQIYFDVDNKRMYLKEYDSSKKQESFHDNFSEVTASYGLHELEIPEYVIFKNFVIANNPDEVKGGNVLHEVWFYALPDGSCQPVVINLLCQYEQASDDQQVGIRVSPFLGKVELYEIYQTP